MPVVTRHFYRATSYPQSIVRISLCWPLLHVQSVSRRLAMTCLSKSIVGANKEIVPFALVDIGFRWHRRAYGRANVDLRNFALTPMSGPEVLASNPENHAQAHCRHPLAPHRRAGTRPAAVLPAPKNCGKDFPIIEAMLKFTMRTAVAGDVLRRLSIDSFTPNVCRDLIFSSGWEIRHHFTRELVQHWLLGLWLPRKVLSDRHA